MLRSRVVSSYLGLIKISVFVSKGCPQRGILPPLLYCLLKDSLLTLLNGNGFYSQSFADDLVILIIGLMQSARKLVEDWCNSLEQTANPDETKLVLFSKKRVIPHFKPPTFFGKKIQPKF